MLIERMKILSTLLSFMGMALLISACQAPRNNPLDPENPNHELSTLSGYIKSARAPHPPISNVRVSLPKQNIYAMSDDQGFFKFSHLFSQANKIVVSKPGYVSDSLLLDDNRSQELEIFLNQIPVINEFSVNTLVINQYPDWQFFYLQVTASIEDNDQDTDSVWFDIPAAQISRNLLFNPDRRQYETRLSINDLNVHTLNSFMGLEFQLYVKDMSRHEFNLASAQISRIIEDQIQLENPANYSPVSVQPLLQWQRFEPGYECTYTIEIYTDTFFPTLVWQKSGLSQDTIETTVDNNLQNGEYFWVIWCVDGFGNRSRSKPASFIIQ
jgi:hypothetical protein